MNVIDLFDHGVSIDPDASAFCQDGRDYSYAYMQNLSMEIGAALAKRAISENPHVAVYSPNDATAFGCILGAHRAGGTWVPLNARGSLPDNVDFLNTAEVQVIFYNSMFAEQIAQIREQVSTLEQLICIDKHCGEDLSLEEFVAEGADYSIPDFGCDPHRQTSIFGTGGTTGRSKGVVHNNLVFETMISQMGQLMTTAKPPVHLMVAPMTHGAGGLCYILLSMGAKTVVLTQLDPTSILKAIEEHKVTHLFLPPTLFYVLLAHPDVGKFDYSSLRYFLVSAAPVAPEKIKEGIKVFGPCICQCWGQTEAPMILTWMPPEDFAEAAASGDDARLLSCGKGLLLSRIEVMDDDGNILEQGATGELVVRGNLVTPGYYKNPEATAEAQAHGWHHTGDIGYRDERGYFYIIDRKKDMIVTGGFNVFGAEVEKAINSHPAVVDVAVVGVPDEKWGEAIKAVVQLKPDAAVSAEELMALCKDQLGGVKTPKSVDFVDALPRSPVGKVLKREIRDQYWKNQSRRVG